DVDAAADDEVFLAIDNPDMFAAIDHCNVARSQPSVVECLEVGFGVVEIPGRHETAGEFELTARLTVERQLIASVVHEAHTQTGERLADRSMERRECAVGLDELRSDERGGNGYFCHRVLNRHPIAERVDQSLQASRVAGGATH